MIEISSLTEDDKKREVRYTSHSTLEYGRITSWNSKFIFVRYHVKVEKNGGKQTPRYGETSEATSPEDLEFTV